ncbi:DedA family protein [Bombella sp. TMW 2.2543]|uniref:DedA family protein n=1 Tax=Bombella pluederhausensis TaxID=2967336 RepID=A0ABT3WH35_9PROT|nr:DedA family protein [Bombella pluederhausensis]MCX5618384.1 DedA family protein [Bombella pluederhausensis]
MLESTGIPLPAESLLILASLYASHTHHFAPEWLITAAVSGAIIGDNIGYIVGYQVGYHLLEKHGHKIGLHKDRLTLGRYLFRRVGGVGVLLGRFIAFLRILIAPLAGASRMSWGIFTIYNALGGLLWGTFYVLVPYELGSQIESFTGPAGLGLAAVMLALLGGSFLFLRHHEHALIKKAIADEKRREARKKKGHHH